MSFKYKIMFEPSANNLFKLINYFATFNYSVLVSRNDEVRRVNTKSLIGWLSLGLTKYDTITLYFDKEVNVKDVKNKLDLVEI